MADKLPASLRVDDFNRWKVDDLKKYSKRKRTRLIELSVNSWLLPLPYISIVVANVDDLGLVDVDCQTLLTNESNGATYTTGSESSSGGMDARIAAMGVKS